MNITHGFDPDGQATVSVHMSNHPEPAVLYREDYEEVLAQVGNVSWFTFSDGQGHTYVSTQPRGGVPRVMVARLLVPCPRGMQVRYSDGNRLNLRRGNLVPTRNPYSNLPVPPQRSEDALPEDCESALPESAPAPAITTTTTRDGRTVTVFPLSRRKASSGGLGSRARVVKDGSSPFDAPIRTEGSDIQPMTQEG